MSSDKKTQEFATLFNLPDAHRLKLGNVNRVKKNRMIYETRWLDEHDGNRKLIARFRTWKNLSLQPPYAKQVGWERYCLSGNLLDREIRYSKRDNMEYVH